MIKSQDPIFQPLPQDFQLISLPQVFHIPSAVPAGDAWDIHLGPAGPGPTTSQGRALKNDAGTSDLVIMVDNHIPIMVNITVNSEQPLQ